MREHDTGNRDEWGPPQRRLRNRCHRVCVREGEPRQARRATPKTRKAVQPRPDSWATRGQHAAKTRAARRN